MRTVLFSAILLIALTGCKPLWDPTFMPSGYNYHHDEYKSPPGPEATPIGYTYCAAKNTTVNEAWHHAASDLVLRAKANDIRPAGDVYLTTDINAGAFQSAFDSALREELRAQGYRLVNDPAEAVTLFYTAYDPVEQGQPESIAPYNDEAHHPNKDGDFLPPSKTLELILGHVENGNLGKKVSALYDVPLYGFKPAGYAPAHDRPFMGGAHSDQEDTQSAYND